MGDTGPVTAPRRGTVAALGVLAAAGLLPTLLNILAGDLPRLANLAAQTALALAGLLMWHAGDHQRSGSLLLLTSAAIGVSQLDGDWFWQTGGYWPQVGFMLEMTAVALVAPVLLGYPATTAAPRRYRVLLAVVWVWALVPRAVGPLFWDPAQFGDYNGPAEWFTVTASREVAVGAERVLIASLVLVAGWFATEEVLRFRRARGMARTPTRWVAAGGALLAVGLLARQVARFGSDQGWISPPTQQVLDVAHLTVLAVVPVVLLVVSVRVALGRTAVLERMVAGSGDPAAVQEALRRELDDPCLSLRFSRDGAWLDADGRPVPEPARDARQRVLQRLRTPGTSWEFEVEMDPAALSDPVRLRVALGSAALVLENATLALERTAHLAELRASRTRIVEAGEVQRRRLERDLHDGAQQHLLTVAASLSRAGLATEPAQVESALADARTQLATAMSELRRLARGIHPVALSQGGLAGGLQAMTVLYRDVDLHLGAGLAQGQRLDPALEATAYFVVAEAVANAHRHATGPVVVEADATDAGLVASVSDGGPGGARMAEAGGLQGLADRTHALGGHLVVESPLGAGTTVSLWLPPAQSGRA